MTLPQTGSPPADRDVYTEALTAIVKRFAWVMGAAAALGIARRISQLSVNDAGDVLAHDWANPHGTLRLLVGEYAGVFGDSAITLVRQAVQDVLGDAGDRLLEDAGVLPPVNPPPIRILLVDDHVLFREGLAGLLNAEPDLRVIGQAGSTREALSMARNLKPDVILMDITLPDGSGVDAAHAIVPHLPATRIIMLTMHEDDDHLFAAIRAGAMGYLFKNIRTADLLKRVRGVARGEAGISPAVARRILDEFSRLPGSQPSSPIETIQLTAREIEIVRELARGVTNREIAYRLVISENTVKNHVSNVLAKLHLRSRRDVADYLRDHDLDSAPTAPPR